MRGKRTRSDRQSRKGENLVNYLSFLGRRKKKGGKGKDLCMIRTSRKKKRWPDHAANLLKEKSDVLPKKRRKVKKKGESFAVYTSQKGSGAA